MSGVGDGEGLTLSETEVNGAGQYRYSLSKKATPYRICLTEDTYICAHIQYK